MKKTSILIVLLCSTFTCSYAQINVDWKNQYARESAHLDLKAAELSDGNIIFGNQDLLYKINADGDSLDKINFNPDFRSMKNIAAIDDAFFVSGNINGTAAIAKYNNDLTFVQAKEIGKGFGDASAIYIDGSDYFVSGSNSNDVFISKFDDNLDTAWQISVPYYGGLTKIIKLSDGNYLASGNYDDYPLAVKFNSAGDTLWTFQEIIFISFSYADVFEKDNGNIVLVNGRHYTELDANGVKVKEDFFTNNHFNSILVKNDSIYLFGSKFLAQFGAEKKPYIQIRNLDFDSLYSYTWEDSIHLAASNGFTHAIELSTGGMLAVGKIRDTVDVTANTYNYIAMKFNDGGPSSFEKIKDLYSSMILYPNPATSNFRLQHNNYPAQISIYSILGNLVHTEIVNSENQLIDIASLKTGLYFISDSKGNTSKFIKQ